MSTAEELKRPSPPFEIILGDEHTGFSGSVRMMTEVANSFGVSVTAQELKDWQTLGRASYVIDQYLDAEKNTPRPDIAVELFSGMPIPGIPEKFTDDLRQWLERQPDERQVEINRQQEKLDFWSKRKQLPLRHPRLLLSGVTKPICWPICCRYL